MQGHFGFIDGRNGRSADTYKAPLKEKFVSLYEDIFAGRSPLHTAKDQGVQGRALLTRFWDELLLLKVNEAFLSQFIGKLSEEELRVELKPVINRLFATYSTYLSDGNFIRVAHALETITIFLREVFKKRFTEQGYTIITLVCGSVEQSDSFFRRLIVSVAGLLTRDDVPILVKSLGLRLFLTILTATDNVNTNSIASYLFVNNIFDALLAVFNLKISGDRKKLEFDASLVLILLLLWRESPNPYTERLATNAAPIIPLLNTILSLLSAPPKFASTNVNATSISKSIWSNADGVIGYFGSLWSMWGPSESNGSLPSNVSGAGSVSFEPVDTRWSNITAALLLIYVLCYLSPGLKTTQCSLPELCALKIFTIVCDVAGCMQICKMAHVKSHQAWPSSDFVPVPGGVTNPTNTLSSIWLQVLRSFFSLCKEILSSLPTSGAAGALRGKLCLTILRCIAEDHVSADFLSRADADNYSLIHVSSNAMVGIPTVVQFKSLSCVVLDLAVGVLAVRPDGSAYTDPDLCHRAAILIPIVLNHLRSRGWQLLPSSIHWLGLWQALAETCTWSAPEATFQRPGVPELAELSLSILESCLGNSQDICGAPDETDRLHAMVMAHMNGIQQLVDTASATPFGDGGRSATRGGIKIVNVSAVKYHYEVQVAALGVRGQPTFEQALLGVKKKGLASLKLKNSYAGPGHSYTEGTVDLRILINLVRLLVFEHRQRLASLSASTFKLEIDTKRSKPDRGL